MTDKLDCNNDDTDKEAASVTVDSEDMTGEITETSGTEVTEPTGDVELKAAELDGADLDVIDAAEATDESEDAAVLAAPARRGVKWSRVLAFGVLPFVALLLAAAAAYFKVQNVSAQASDIARTESMQAAKDSTVRLLSYRADTVEQDLTSAREVLTGDFRDSYTQLINDVVIPGAREKTITAIASVPAVASVSAAPDHAVAVVFVNQAVTVGNGAPTSTNSSVRVTLDKIGDRWLISQFDPV